jgi:integrase/recombinase XerD
VIRRSLPLGNWPDADQLAWHGAIADGDIFDQGPAAHWAQTTRNAVIAAYGRWLSFLAVSEPPTLAVQPIDRLTEDRLRRYLNHLAETAGTVGQHMFFAKLRDAVRVMFPGKVPHRLSRLVARLERKCQPRSKAERIVTTVRLTALGIELMKGAIGAEGQVVDRVGYRDGLLIALLSRRPIRRRTFSLIEIGTHLRRIGEEWRMVFEGPETKSGRPLEKTVPKRILPFLERYLGEVRPLFLGANRHAGLWAGTKGGPLKGQAIYGIVAARTRAAFGQPIGPHLFRHCAATTIAILQPARIGVARDLLEHTSLATTNEHYNKARSIEASRHYAGILAQLRPKEKLRSH